MFRKSVPTFQAHASEDAAVPEAVRQQSAEAFAREFNGILDRLLDDPSAAIPGHQAQPINCKNLCIMRDRCLINAGFADIFKAVKDKENLQCLKLLPEVISDLESISEDVSRLELAVKGVFAGTWLCMMTVQVAFL